jgi:hypothetical protein
MRRSLISLLAAPGVKARAAAAAAKEARGQGARKGDAASADSLLELARPVLAPPPLPEAERARRRRLMINYGRLKRAEHLESERKVNRFLVAKWSALDALPHLRRVEAMRPRDEEPPLNRPLWTVTPPIGKHFNPGELTGRRKQ